MEKNSQQEATSEWKRILVRLPCPRRSHPKLGDYLLATPALAGLREMYPQARITLLVGPTDPGSWLLDRTYFDDYLIDAGHRLHNLPLHTLSLLSKIKRGKFDIAVSLWSNSRTAWLFKMGKIPVRIGSSSRDYGKLYTHNVPREQTIPTKHEVEYHLEILRALGYSGSPGRLHYAHSAEDVARADELLRGAGVGPGSGFVALNPTCGGSSRNWQAEGFVCAARQILRETGLPLVLIGAASDQEHNARLAAALEIAPADLTGRTNVAVLAALLSRASAHISVDTGTMHLAAAMQTPCVAIFPFMHHWEQRVRWRPWQTEYRLIGPRVRCSDCVFGKCMRTQNACMESIPPEEIAAAALDLLSVVGGKPPRRPAFQCAAERAI